MSKNFRASERNQVYLKWRANERRAELIRAMPSAADIMKLPSAAENAKKNVCWKLINLTIFLPTNHTNLHEAFPMN